MGIVPSVFSKLFQIPPLVSSLFFFPTGGFRTRHVVFPAKSWPLTLACPLGRELSHDILKPAAKGNGEILEGIWLISAKVCF